MDGILVINKKANYTSRDVVNIISKKFNTKKVGHTGTLDPQAEGVLVLCIGKALKMCELLTNHDKEYIAEVILGIETDTLDMEGNILKNINTYIPKEKIIKSLQGFNKTYMQEVPIYSAIKVNGKKLYEYARKQIPVTLPKKEVTIKNIELIDKVSNINNQTHFKFKCTVSKGTYIRSLIRDIGVSLSTPATMKSLIRTRQGIFDINESYTLEDINNDNYKIISIEDSFPNIPTKIVDKETAFKIKNGVPINKFDDTEISFIKDNDNNLLALYKNKEDKAKVYKMFV